ncbi:hypothetical protein Poli38472_002525 [Pythium oligandrum]|uniref:Calcineurin-like phosphoesterase domain-containing protein n=1 Tax=Pythium oligandrum TaxID=41045 RepID=A0A8K1FJX1_PYTOL|nr:hypothetical protein Poli38472_002525 [Pythium oligandrum]|eukprot:TMW63584.1 hypothetical protein Poli38472_002525 [Pythium oligandrum]
MGSWLAATAVVLFGQVGVFYLYAYRCALTSANGASDPSALRALVVSDVHLLGKRRRTWIERIWIDWQITIALQAANHAHAPEIVLVLGDQLDEGGYPTSDEDWQEYTSRFTQAMASLRGKETLFLMGNHDAAFGRYLTKAGMQRYELAFGPANRLMTVKGHKIIHLNTMALDTDVKDPEVRAQAASFLQTLETLEPEEDTSVVLLTHLPLFRNDDLLCGPVRSQEGGHITYEHPSFRYSPFHHVLSRQLSSQLLTTIRPSVVLSGHTHAWCEYDHTEVNAKEFTIPAFSWGQRPDPSYGVLHLSGRHATVTTCSLPTETHLFALYGISILLFVAKLIWRASTRRLVREKKDT